VTDATDQTEYRIERLRHRLAHGDQAELGLHIEARADAVAVVGTVADAECRDAVLRAVADELSGLTFHVDVSVAAADAPTRAEEL
jgi:hypothetical protein